MSRNIFLTIIAASLSLMAVAADVTIVDNQEMTAVAGADGWYKYTIDVLSEGDEYSLMFNNGGWDGGKTNEYAVASAYLKTCFTSSGSGSDVVETDCPTTEAEQEALTDGTLSVYSNNSRIYGNTIGAVAIYSMSGACMQVIDAEGSFSTRQLPQGFYIVSSNGVETKILVM